MKKKIYQHFLLIVATAIAVATAGCNLPGASKEEEDDIYPDYTYVFAQANHLEEQSWIVSIEYQCPSDPTEVGIIVMRDNTEVRRVLAKKKGSAYPSQGTLEVDFTWQKGEQGCHVCPFVSTSTEGVTTGDDFWMPFGIAINSSDIKYSDNGTFDISLNYFCDCNINESKLTIYDNNNRIVAEIWEYIYSNYGNQDSGVTFAPFESGLLPKTEYRAVLSLNTEYNSATTELKFTTPAREPYAGDNNPPQV